MEALIMALLALFLFGLHVSYEDLISRLGMSGKNRYLENWRLITDEISRESFVVKRPESSGYGLPSCGFLKLFRFPNLLASALGLVFFSFNFYFLNRNFDEFDEAQETERLIQQTIGERMEENPDHSTEEDAEESSETEDKQIEERKEIHDVKEMKDNVNNLIDEYTGIKDDKGSDEMLRTEAGQELGSKNFLDENAQDIAKHQEDVEGENYRDEYEEPLDKKFEEKQKLKLEGQDLCEETDEMNKMKEVLHLRKSVIISMLDSGSECNLQSIMESLNVVIKLSNISVSKLTRYQTITISGRKEDVTEAKKRILDAFPMEEFVQESLNDVNPCHFPKITGVENQNLKRLIQTHRVCLSVPRGSGGMVNPDAVITVSGRKSNVLRAIRDIRATIARAEREDNRICSLS